LITGNTGRINWGCRCTGESAPEGTRIREFLKKGTLKGRGGRRNERRARQESIMVKEKREIVHEWVPKRSVGLL